MRGGREPRECGDHFPVVEGEIAAKLEIAAYDNG